MKTLLLDTNAFLRYLLNDIPLQANEVSSLLSSARKGEVRIIVPQIVVFEVAFALEKYYRFSKEVVLEKLTAIISFSYLTVQDVELFSRSLDLFKIHSLGFVDCFLQCFAEKKGASVFTFDKKFRKISVSSG